MDDAGRHGRNFKARLAGGGPLLGTFLKTAAPQLVEIIASVGLDFAVIDQEHAPLGREAIDLLLLAASSRGLPVLVRVAHPGEIAHALDSGAAGIIAPHVRTKAEAEAVVSACCYIGGSRGYSNSPRAGDYGRVAMAEHVRLQDAAVNIIVMIEDLEAVANAEEIMAVEGVDATLIGCADLAVSLGELASGSSVLAETVSKVASAASAARHRILAPAATVQSAGWLLDLGISALVIGSDQGLLRCGANAALEEFNRASIGNAEMVR